MTESIKSASHDPDKDLRWLYQQMTFNALTGNTDDHLKIFPLIHKGRGYKLSPAYNLRPTSIETKSIHFSLVPTGDRYHSPLCSLSASILTSVSVKQTLLSVRALRMTHIGAMSLTGSMCQQTTLKLSVKTLNAG